MTRVSLAVLGIAFALVAGEAPAASFAKQELSIPMDDGVPLAASLYLPDASPPSGDWPALVFLHGFGADRTQTNALVEASGFADGSYAVLSVDARGHGQSGGLVGIAGAREIADLRAVHAWLAARPDIADDAVGAWGISYGGGILLNSLAAGVPWRAVATVESWTDLFSALMPHGLVKSGLVSALAAGIPDAKRDPSVALALQAAASTTNLASARPWAEERSSLERLAAVSTPVFMAQGRRDFLFGIEQGTLAFMRLQGPRVLYVGLHGHTPSTFPAADTGLLMERIRAFFDCHLRAISCDPRPTAVYVAPETFAGTARRFNGLPRTRPKTIPLPGVTTFARAGKAVRRSPPLQRAVEVFGVPTVQVSVAASGGWSRLVAVLTARTPQGREIVVSSGGIPTRNETAKLTIRLVGQAVHLPKGTRLTLTLASASPPSSTASPLYLDQPQLPSTARLRVGTAVVRLPGLRTPVTT